MVMAVVLMCSCTRYSSDRIHEIGISAVGGAITSDKIDELLDQTDWLLDNASPADQLEKKFW